MFTNILPVLSFLWWIPKICGQMYTNKCFWRVSTKAPKKDGVGFGSYRGAVECVEERHLVLEADVGLKTLKMEFEMHVTAAVCFVPLAGERGEWAVGASRQGTAAAKTTTALARPSLTRLAWFGRWGWTKTTRESAGVNPPFWLAKSGRKHRFVGSAASAVVFNYLSRNNQAGLLKNNTVTSCSTLSSRSIREPQYLTRPCHSTTSRARTQTISTIEAVDFFCGILFFIDYKKDE